jgi:hypothetical protein
MDELFAFPIPVDSAASPWLTVVFALMALAGFTVIVMQAVRYFRSDGNEPDPRFGNGSDDEPGGPSRDERVE